MICSATFAQVDWHSEDDVMRERIRFENELVSLGLLDVRPAERDFETKESLPYEVLEPFLIKGGLYSPKEKAFHARDRDGLILTANIVGRQEKKLAAYPRAPATVTLGKELSLG